MIPHSCHTAILLAAIALMLAALPVVAQRRITPVAPPKGVSERTEPVFDRSRLKEITDSQGRVVLVDTVTGAEVVDSTAVEVNRPGNIYPLFEGATLGVNVMDLALRALGQQYGLLGVKAEVSLHNRYKPFVEVGLSMADYTPDGNNYTFHSPMAPYFKIGAGYNIFYNSNPDYQLCFNLSYGLSNFSYRYRDITVDEGYWNDPSHFDLPSQRVTAGYLEIGASIKVKIAGPVSAGWSVVYHSRLHESANTYGPPVVIPGYGKRIGALSVGMYLMWNLHIANNGVSDK